MQIKKKHRSLLGTVFGFLFTATTFAAGFPPPIYVLDPIVVTARGRDSLSSATPGGVGVIYPEEIFENQPISPADITSRIPGVDKSSDSVWGSDIIIRGLGRNRIILLIDGCRVNTATDINAQFGLIDPMEIERIEVLKGPISALYGSGALGGVVNIITRKGEFGEKPAWHGELSTAYWTNPSGPNFYGNVFRGTHRNWLYASASHRDHASSLDGSGQETRNSQFDDHYGKLQGGIQWNPLNISEIQFQRYAANEVGVPGTGLAALPVQSDVTYADISRSLLNFHHVLTPEHPNFRESKINAYVQRIERDVRIDSFPTGPFREIRPEARHDTIGIQWQNRFQMSAHTLMAGMDFWNWEYTGTRTRRFRDGTTLIDSPLADSQQFSGGLFAEDDWQLADRWTLNLGVRADYITEKSDNLFKSIVPQGPLIRPAEQHEDISWGAHVGLTWRFQPHWTLTAIGASSYRAPDLLDRFKYIFFTPGNELFGNPDLKPERSLFGECGLNYNTPKVRLSAGAFFNSVQDLIVDPSPGRGVRQLENVDNAEIYGVETEGEWHFLRLWKLYANLVYTQGRNVTKNEDLSFIPPLNGLAGIRFDHPSRFRFSGEVVWAARQDRVPPGTASTAGWVTLNANVGYRLAIGATGHEFAVGVHNLLDANYRNHLSTSRGVALKEPGINLTVTWRMDF